MSPSGDAAERAATQAEFDTPEQAAEALRVACEARDVQQLRAIFGPRTSELGSGDPDQDDADVQRLAAAMNRRLSIARDGDDEATLVIGLVDFEFPAPLVREGSKWRFDTDEGIERVNDLRVGKNELDAIAACRFYVLAQREYYALDPNGDSIKEYAARLASTPGTKDGLYWPDPPEGTPISPFGAAVAKAVAAGDLSRERAGSPQPYRGYYYRILTRQGPDAPGGAMNYFDSDGRMTRGFALIAWPAEYDKSGVQTFIVSNAGVVYQRDLGDDTDAKAKAIDEFDPSSEWTPVAPKPQA